MSGKTVRFHAPELCADGSFHTACYAFMRDGSGWSVYREGALQEHLGEGYVLVQPRLCGVCATDLARPYLPFPLPQIVGHEVLALHEGRPVVVEINASHSARDLDPAPCPECREGLPTHCPERVTLGIDRLPGGFAPFMLAPARGILPVPEGLSMLTAAFAEPFAAALHAVEATPPAEGEEVAVLGPRRLGLLLIAALDAFRRRKGARFRVTAILRHPLLSDLCHDLGADRVLDVADGAGPALQGAFDTVFDTSGTPEGFSLALFLARTRVHLKSTHGKPAAGLAGLTDMVVGEISLLPYQASRFVRPRSASRYAAPCSTLVYLAPSVSDAVSKEVRGLSRVRSVPDPGAPEEASAPFRPEVDVAVVSTLEEIDRLLGRRPGGEARIRPRGDVLMARSDAAGPSSPLYAALSRGVGIQTSRCGSLQQAVETLATEPRLGAILESRLITHTFSLSRIDEAFRVAADSSTSIKVMVDMGL